MNPLVKLQRIGWRFSQYGILNTILYSVDLLLGRLSPNYRLDSARVKSKSAITFVVFIITDAFNAMTDVLITRWVRLLGGRHEIHLEDTEPYSLYKLDTKQIPATPIVYSFGIGKNIDFDQAVFSRHRSPIYLFDPTPPALAFIETKLSTNPHLIFHPIGLWTESKKMKFYFDRNRMGSGNLSITNFFQTDGFIEANCLTLEDVMRLHGHAHIDVLKLDIEGAALPVLIRMLGTNIRPTQIVAELEIPKRIYGASFKEIRDFYKKRRALFSALEKNGYRMLTYGKAEFLAVLQKLT